MTPENSRAENSRAENSRAENSRAENSRAENTRAEQPDSTRSTGRDTDVAPVSYADLGPGVEGAAAAEIDLLGDVEMTVTVELGRTRMRIRDLLKMTEGSLIELTRGVGEAVDVLVNGSVIAHGDVVVVDDELGIRITEFASRQ